MKDRSTVPVEIISPGKRVITFEWKETRKYGEKIILETTFSLWTCPLSTVVTLSFVTSSISSVVASTEPKLKNMSKLLALVP